MISRFLRGTIRIATLAGIGVLAAGGATHKAVVKPSVRPPVPKAQAIAVDIRCPERLGPFFDSLNASVRPATSPEVPRIARVLHFGDSHVEADFWTGDIRTLFQARFGDAGPGFVMPGRPWPYFRHVGAESRTGGGWMTIGLGKPPNDGILGLAGTALSAGPGARYVSVTATFSGVEVEIASMPGDGEVRVSVDTTPIYAGPTHLTDLSDPTQLTSSKATTAVDLDPESLPAAGRGLLCCRHMSLSSGTHTVTITPTGGGPVRVLGATFYSGQPGVIWDSLGLIGETIEKLESWDPVLRRALLQHARPSLIVVSYGTNEMGESSAEIAGYRDECERILSGLRRDAPDAAILVTGPCDRDSWYRSSHARLQVNRALIIAALREAAESTGCAFWDAQAAMGGPGGARTWYSAGYMQRDLTHLTQAGYAKLAELLFTSMMNAYDSHNLPRSGG